MKVRPSGSLLYLAGVTPAPTTPRVAPSSPSFPPIHDRPRRCAVEVFNRRQEFRRIWPGMGGSTCQCSASTIETRFPPVTSLPAPIPFRPPPTSPRSTTPSSTSTSSSRKRRCPRAAAAAARARSERVLASSARPRRGSRERRVAVPPSRRRRALISRRAHLSSLACARRYKHCVPARARAQIVYNE
jgi:hypothetical protein